MKKWVIGAVFSLLLPISVLAQGLDIPAPDGYVRDDADILSSEVESAIEADIAEFEAETTAEIGVATTPSLQETTIEDLAVHWFEEWGIGKEETDNGVLLLIIPSERQARIEVGYGVEGDLTDVEAGRILNDVMFPYFKEGDYEAGVTAAVGAIEEEVRGGTFEELYVPENTETFWDTFFLGLILGFAAWMGLFFAGLWYILMAGIEMGRKRSKKYRSAIARKKGIAEKDVKAKDIAKETNKFLKRYAKMDKKEKEKARPKLWFEQPMPRLIYSLIFVAIFFFLFSFNVGSLIGLLLGGYLMYRTLRKAGSMLMGSGMSSGGTRTGGWSSSSWGGGSSSGGGFSGGGSFGGGSSGGGGASGGW